MKQTREKGYISYKRCTKSQSFELSSTWKLATESFWYFSSHEVGYECFTSSFGVSSRITNHATRKLHQHHIEVEAAASLDLYNVVPCSHTSFISKYQLYLSKQDPWLPWSTLMGNFDEKKTSVLEQTADIGSSAKYSCDKILILSVQKIAIPRMQIFPRVIQMQLRIWCLRIFEIYSNFQQLWKFDRERLITWLNGHNRELVTDRVLKSMASEAAT